MSNTVPKRVLLIEDDNKTRSLWIKMLIAKGYDACGVGDGAKGVEEAVNFRPDIIVLDVQLPSLDGFEVLEQIKSRNIPTRVMMISGVEKSSDAIVRAIKGGACDYIMKPVKVARVFEKISRYLITEDTLNTSVVRTPSYVVEAMAGEIGELIDEVRKQANEIRELKRLNASLAGNAPGFWETGWKTLLRYILAALVLVITLYRAVPGLPGVVLVLGGWFLLLVPWERVTNFTGKVSGAAASFNTHDKGSVNDRMNDSDAAPSSPA